ncbi:MAG: CBS domain-containing protein, partial [Nitrososphaeraceae archaeon]
MTTRLQTIGMSETAKDAAKKMVDKNVSSLIVIDDDNQTVGIITER